MPLTRTIPFSTRLNSCNHKAGNSTAFTLAACKPCVSNLLLILLLLLPPWLRGPRLTQFTPRQTSHKSLSRADIGNDVVAPKHMACIPCTMHRRCVSVGSGSCMMTVTAKL